MLAAALLVSLLLQAEPAPAPAAGPAEPAPAAAPSPPMPATPGPAASPPPMAAPAQPALPPLAAPPEPSLPANSVSVHVRYAYRLGSEGDVLVPTAGLSLGGEFERRLHGFRSGIEIGAAFDFFYDRFSKDVPVAVVGPSGEQQLMIAAQTLSQNTFALMETTAWRYADMRLFAAAGGGFSFGYFSGGTTSTQPLVRGVFGFDFAIAARTAAILRVDYNHTFKHQGYATAGAVHPLFGDTFDAGIGFLVRF